MRLALPVGLAATLAILTTCIGCSTSTLVQTSEIAPLLSSVLAYHDEAAVRMLDAGEAATAQAESDAVRALVEAPEIGRGTLADALGPVLIRYELLVQSDPDLSEAWRLRRLRDVPILRRVAGLSGE